MRLTLQVFVLFGAVTIVRISGTFGSPHHSANNATAAAKAAWAAIAKPNAIEPVTPYDASRKLFSKDPHDVHFRLYSNPDAPAEYEVIEFGNLASLRLSHYDPAHSLKVLIHGFDSNGNSSFPQNVKNAYLALKAEIPYNILVVDWGVLSTANAKSRRSFYYTSAVGNFVTVGTRVGDFIGWLKRNKFLDLKKVHVIGHSLGAHVSGVVGDSVKKAFGRPLPRITALDPAGPEFGKCGTLARCIRPADAAFVDAYHTNAGFLGLNENVGHVDFFVNGGTAQPGCGSNNFLTTLRGSCSHARAPVFWTKSILDGPDVKICSCSTYQKYTKKSSRCESKVHFGEYCAPGAVKGRQYVTYLI